MLLFIGDLDKRLHDIYCNEDDIEFETSNKPKCKFIKLSPIGFVSIKLIIYCINHYKFLKELLGTCNEVS